MPRPSLPPKSPDLTAPLAYASARAARVPLVAAGFVEVAASAAGTSSELGQRLWSTLQAALRRRAIVRHGPGTSPAGLHTPRSGGLSAQISNTGAVTIRICGGERYAGFVPSHRVWPSPRPWLERDLGQEACPGVSPGTTQSQRCALPRLICGSKPRQGLGSRTPDPEEAPPLQLMGQQHR